jgi:hypothetical protein
MAAAVEGRSHLPGELGIAEGPLQFTLKCCLIEYEPDGPSGRLSA